MADEVTKKKVWYQEKTIWAAVALIASTILPMFMTLDPAILDGIKTVIAGLALIFARQAIENTK